MCTLPEFCLHFEFGRWKILSKLTLTFSSATLAFFHHSMKAADKRRDIQRQQKFSEQKLMGSWDEVELWYQSLHPFTETIGGHNQGDVSASNLSGQCHRCFKSIETFYGLAVSTYLGNRFTTPGFRDCANVKAWLLTETVRQSYLSTFICIHLCLQLLKLLQDCLLYYIICLKEKWKRSKHDNIWGQLFCCCLKKICW